MGRQGGDPMKALVPLMTKEDLAAMQETVAKTYISDLVVAYAVKLIDATRHHDKISRGASPRATLSVVAVAKALAQLQGRDYVVPKDVQEAFLKTVGHRLLLTTQAENSGIAPESLLREILQQVDAPKAG